MGSSEVASHVPLAYDYSTALGEEVLRAVYTSLEWNYNLNEAQNANFYEKKVALPDVNDFVKGYLDQKIYIGRPAFLINIRDPKEKYLCVPYGSTNGSLYGISNPLSKALQEEFLHEFGGKIPDTDLKLSDFANEGYPTADPYEVEISPFAWRGIIHAEEFLKGTQPFCYFSRTDHLGRVNMGFGDDKPMHEHLYMAGSWDHMGETNSRIFDVNQIKAQDDTEIEINLPQIIVDGAIGGAVAAAANKSKKTWLTQLRKITGTNQEE